MFSLRIVTTDHYLSAPIPGLDVEYADLRGSEVKKVPVVRIFGATPTGQKTCMHVHGVFPYLYVPYDGTAPWDRYLRQFSTSLDRALNVAQGHGQTNMEHIYKIVLVSGRSMYGFHDKEEQFLKIYLYNPVMVKKAADLLLGAAVLNKAFQPHESHIPYTLQLFVDYNLYGMNMINVAAVKFRSQPDRDVIPGSPGSNEGLGADPKSQSPFPYSLNRSGSITPSTRFWEQENIPSDLCIDVERQSTCSLEVDVVAADILNRLEVNANVGANPGLAALWEDERERLRTRGLSTDDIAPPTSPGRVDVEASDSEQLLQERLRQIILDLEPYMDSQSESDEEISQEDVVPSTPASLAHLHLSQTEDELPDSQDTVMLDIEDRQEEPIVNIESIKRVVSASQSFRDVMPQLKQGDSHDKSLIDILAALADDNSEPASSQEAASQVATLEEQDSVLSLTPRPRDPEVEGQEEAEILEMSQRIWDEDTVEDIQEQPSPEEVEQEYDLAGMDETWQDSQLDAVTKDDDEAEISDADSDIIPQFDGAVDEQPPGLSKKQVTKRLGIHGPATNLSVGGPQFNNNVYGSRPNFPPMAQPGQHQQFNSPGYDSFQGFPSETPPWAPGPRPAALSQYPPPTSRAPWQPGQSGQPGQPWGGASMPRQPVPGLQYSGQPRPQPPTGQQMPAYRPRAGDINGHMNLSFNRSRAGTLERLPNQPLPPHHTSSMYRPPAISARLATELPYKSQSQPNKAGYGLPNQTYNQHNQHDSAHHMYPGGHHRPQLPVPVQKESGHNVSPRLPVGPHGDFIASPGTRPYGTAAVIPAPGGKSQTNCITLSERSQLSHMEIAGSGEQLRDNHMPSPVVSHMAQSASSHMATSRLSHMPSSGSFPMATARSAHMATTGKSPVEASKSANRLHVEMPTPISDDGMYRSHMMAPVSTNVSHGGYMAAPLTADGLHDNHMASQGLADKSHASHKIQPGLHDVSQDSQMTSPASTDMSRSGHVAFSGSADLSRSGHMASPRSADRSYGGCRSSPGSADRSPGSHMASPRSAGSHMASPGSADLSHGSHMASQGSHAMQQMGAPISVTMSQPIASISQPNQQISLLAATKPKPVHPVPQPTGYVLKRPPSLGNKAQPDSTIQPKLLVIGDQAQYQRPANLLSPKSNNSFQSSRMSAQINPHFQIPPREMQDFQRTASHIQPTSGGGSKSVEDISPGRNREVHVTGQQTTILSPTSLSPNSLGGGHLGHSNHPFNSMDRPLGTYPHHGWPATTKLDTDTARSTGNMMNRYDSSGGHLAITPPSKAVGTDESKSSNSYIVRQPQHSSNTKPYQPSKPVPGEIVDPQLHQMLAPNYNTETVYRQNSSEEHQPLLSPTEKQNFHANFHSHVMGANQKATELIKSQHSDHSNSDASNSGTIFQDIVQNLDARQQAAFNRGRQSIRSANLTTTVSASQPEAAEAIQHNQALNSVCEKLNTSSGGNLNANHGSPCKGQGRPRKDSVQFENVHHDSLKQPSKSVFPFNDNCVGPISEYYAKHLGKLQSSLLEQSANESLSLSEFSPVSSSHVSVRPPGKSSAALEKLLLEPSEPTIPKPVAKRNESHNLLLSSPTSEQNSNALNNMRSSTSSLTSPVIGYFAGDPLLRSPSNSSSNSSHLLEQNKPTLQHRPSVDSVRSKIDSSMGSDVSWNGSQEDLFADNSSMCVNSQLGASNVPARVSQDNSASLASLIAEDSSRMGAHSLREQSASPLTVISINTSRADQPVKNKFENDTLLSSLETFVGSVKKDEYEQYGVDFTKSGTSQFSVLSAQNKPQSNIKGNISSFERPSVIELPHQIERQFVPLSDTQQQNSSQLAWSQFGIDNNSNSLPNTSLHTEKPKKRAYTKKNPTARSFSIPEEAAKRRRGRPRKDSFINNISPTSRQSSFPFQPNEQVTQFVQNQPPLPEYQYPQQQFSDNQQPSQSQHSSCQNYLQKTQLDISQVFNGQPGLFSQLPPSEEFQSKLQSSRTSLSQVNTQVPELPYDHQLPESVLFSQRSEHNVDNQFQNALQVQQFQMENFKSNSFLQELESIDTANFPQQNHNSIPIPQNSVSVQNIAANQTHLPQMPQYQLSELLSIQRKVTSMPQPCKSYTYQFPIPTPLFKRLKIKDKLTVEMDTDIEFVRMHPKDARRYSLLKIGEEVVQLANLSEEMIEEVQNKLLAGINVEAIPPPLRGIGAVGMEPVQSNNDADLTVSMLTPNLAQQELGHISNGTDLNISKQRKQFEIKDKNNGKSMFKNKNIANIPHLKKYRAGFSYFGKGHIGKKSAKHFNPILGPDFEDDENIVLRDVNLTEASEGTLTPLKSRTPIAGRSPAYSAGNVMSDLDSHENKEYLDVKLKSLDPDEHEIGLNSQNNPPADMFDNDLFEEKHDTHTEEETSTDNELQSQGDNDEEDDGNCTMIGKTEPAEQARDIVNIRDAIKKDSMLDVAPVLNGVNNMIPVVMSLIENGCTEANNETSKHVMPDQCKLEVNQSKEYELSDKGMKYLSHIAEKENISMDTTNEVLENECKLKRNIAENDERNAEVFFGKFKKHFEEKMAISQSCLLDTSKSLANYVMKPKGLNRNSDSRSRSSSSESRTGVPASRSNSWTKGSDSLQLLNENSKSSLESVELGQKTRIKRQSSLDMSDTEIKRQKQSISSASSSKSSSRRNSRQNSSDRKKCRSKSRNNYYSVDCDSDGIPGVDYIVTGKFKGHTSMRVILNKLEIGDPTKSLSNCHSENDVLRNKNIQCEDINDKHVNSDIVQHNQNTVQVSPRTGFSAEFEKFLSNLNNSQSESSQKNLCNADVDESIAETDLDVTADCAKQNTDEENCNEIGDLKDFHSVPKIGIYLDKDSTPTSVLLDETCDAESNCSMSGQCLHRNLESLKTDDPCSGDVHGFSNENGECLSFKVSHTSVITESMNCELLNAPSPTSASFNDDGSIMADNITDDIEQSVTGDMVNETHDSSSADEYIKEKRMKKSKRKSHKNKKKTRQNRLSQAFVGKKRRKKNTSSKSSNAKLMSTLSLLHDATMENLSVKGPFSNFPSSNISPFYSKDSTENSSPIKSADCDVYTDKVDDFNACYADTMYKLALFSPPDSEMGDLTPPQPLSPDEIIKSLSSENSGMKTMLSDNSTNTGLNEEKLTLADIKKSVQQSSIPLMGQEFYETPPASSVETIKSKDNSPNSNVGCENIDTETDIDVHDKNLTDAKEVKTAVVKLAPLTLKDIQSICAEENENEAKKSLQAKTLEDHLDNISPPDLGPPNISRVSPRHLTLSNVAPPDLVQNQQTRDELKEDVETNHEKIIRPCSGSPRVMEHNDLDSRPPPFLIPCRSPRIAPTTNSHSLRTVATEGEIKGYFSLPLDHDSKNRIGRSPGANSSSGSINIVKSEEFSDISDDDSENSENSDYSGDDFSNDDNNSCDSNNIINAEYKTKQASANSVADMKDNFSSTDVPSKLNMDDKLKEISEFEKRLKETDITEGSILSMFNKHKNSTYSSNMFHEFPQSANNHENLYGLNNKTPAVKLASRHSFMHVTGSCTEADMLDIIKRGEENIAAKQNRGSITTDFNTQKTSIGNRYHRSNSDIYPEVHQVSSVLSSSLNSQCVTGANSRDLFESTTEDGVYSGIGAKLGMNSGDLFDRDQSNLLSYKGEVNMQTQHSAISHPALVHSLSDSVLRSDYAINRNSRFSDSVIKSLANHSLRQENDLCINTGSNLSTISSMKIDNQVPMMMFGTGDGQQNVNAGTNQPVSKPGNTSQKSGHRAGDGSQHSTGRQMGHNPGKHGLDRSSEGVHDCGTNVITPLTLPPSSESIRESASVFGLSSVQVQDAYYSNPRDIVQRPREGGGHVLRVPSNMLKDLKEFEAAEKIKGLKDWRAIFCVNESWYSSQSDTEVLNEKLEKEPALKYALTGDSAVIISPCVLPPSRNSVEKWFDGRKLYKTLKNQAVKQKGQELVSCQDIDTELSVKDDDNKYVTEGNENPKHKTSEVRLNMFTGKREVLTVVQEADVDSRETHTEETETKDATLPDITNQSFDMDSTSRTTNDSDEHRHSTPMARRLSTELFVPECTPIEGTSKQDVDMKDEQGLEFVTPKRTKPLRRLSANTDATLRRGILTSQMKRQFCTPVQPKDTSQIEGPSPKNSFGFRVSQQNFEAAKALHEHQYVTVMGAELHVETRGDLRPDPEFDSIQAIFYSIYNDVPPESGARHLTGAILIDPTAAGHGVAPNMLPGQAGKSPAPKPGPSHDPGAKVKGRHSPSRSTQSQKLQETLLQKSGVSGLDVLYAKDEKDLLDTFVQLVHRWDVDILVGYEVQMLSWGYLLDRASTLGMNLSSSLSRLPQARSVSRRAPTSDESGADQMSEVHIAGRIVINLWRLLRHEVTLNVYTFENLAFHVLHRRVPLFSYRALTAWYKHRTHLHRWKVIDHYVTRVKCCLDMMLQLDLVGRTSEFARVFGIEFYHVLSRGTQYRVESMMLRVAKPLNFIPMSPSVQQRARMKAPECIPLCLEPESRFYTDPVVVLDFQSLYPSIMIAYNYCFSTCLGRLDWLTKSHDGPIQFGCTSLNVPPDVLRRRARDVTISPNGVAFCTAAVRKGVLPAMVEEILNTRLMVKRAMKGYKDDRTLTRLLHARQLGLKLIANVTYGYTAANFSGRMPCVEVADSIVRKARETLERSIRLVRETPRWGAKVVYGDTDSMFLLMKGQSKDEAFRVGQEIADAVTAMFPKPIKLKFEKVYLPCALEAKKRYVGFMYETPDQVQPVYDAKGIETVRRDSCAAVSKILERSIKILFASHDVSQVKAYVQQQCQKVMEGTVGLQDCIFAKEYRGMAGYKPGACVPGLNIAKKLLHQDRRAEPHVGERVPYVIVYGSPGLPLIQLVRQPRDLLQDGSLRLNTTYYVTKQVLPPLHRLLSLLGVDVFTWYQEMPHIGPRGGSIPALPNDARKGTISQYFTTSNCPVCDRQTKQKVCVECMTDPQLVCTALTARITRWDRARSQLAHVCAACVGCMEPGTMEACTSLDCPVLYRQSRARTDFSRAEHLQAIIDKLF